MVRIRIIKAFKLSDKKKKKKAWNQRGTRPSVPLPLWRGARRRKVGVGCAVPRKYSQSPGRTDPTTEGRSSHRECSNAGQTLLRHSTLTSSGLEASAFLSWRRPTPRMSKARCLEETCSCRFLAIGSHRTVDLQPLPRRATAKRRYISQKLPMALVPHFQTFSLWHLLAILPLLPLN